MANPKKLLYSFSTFLFFVLVIFGLASARPIKDGATFYPAGVDKHSGITPSDHGDPTVEKHDEVKFRVNHRINKVGLAFGPSLMNMLPKGRIPASGPSRRINNANNK